MVISAVTIAVISLVINFVVVLVILAKISRQMDQIHKSLNFLEKKIKEEGVFVTRTSQTVDRIERELKDIEGDIEWKG